MGGSSERGGKRNDDFLNLHFSMKPPFVFLLVIPLNARCIIYNSKPAIDEEEGIKGNEDDRYPGSVGHE